MKDSLETGEVSYTNEHYPYTNLNSPERHALRGVLGTAFHIGSSAHRLWSDFHDTTAFVRRVDDGEPANPDNLIGGAIVMSHQELQLDYLAYIVVRPEYRYHRRFFGRDDQPHHGTELLHYVYGIMRDKVSEARLQKYLMIEPAGNDALRFYQRAFPTNEYPLKFDEDSRIISVAYDGFTL